jgi:hypothetical protein
VIRGHYMRHIPSPARLSPAVLAALALTVSGAGAQVGYPPDRSPFIDLVYRQEFTAFTGWFAAAKDPAGVAPQSGPMLGVRYDVRIGGPASFTAQLATVGSKRTEIDPTRPLATREVATRNAPLFLGDAGITINLTGQRSFRRVVPVVNGGVGLVSDFKSADAGGYRFGTAFAFTFGGGLRYVPGGRFQLRADLSDHFYQLNYPDSYFAPAADSSRLLPADQPKAFWKHNAAITIGASYLFFR